MRRLRQKVKMQKVLDENVDVVDLEECKKFMERREHRLSQMRQEVDGFMLENGESISGVTIEEAADELNCRLEVKDWFVRVVVQNGTIYIEQKRPAAIVTSVFKGFPVRPRRRTD